MKNDYEIRGNTTSILLKSKKYGNMETLIDTEDFDKVNEFPNTWYPCWSPITESFYVNGNNPQVNYKRSMSRLHRVILDVGKQDVFVDHINHDTLDNRKSNLRICSNQQNQFNRKSTPKNNTSGYLGVSWHKSKCKWQAYIKHNGKRINLGTYESPEEANEIVTNTKRELMGDFYNV